MTRRALGLGLLALAASAPAHAYIMQVDDDLDVLRDAAQRWTYELVGGVDADHLAVLPKSSPVTCAIKHVTSTTSQFVCDTGATAQPLAGALVTAPRTLYWDGSGVRELRGAATAEATSDPANAFALTFPTMLRSAQTLQLASTAGATASLAQRIEMRPLHGRPTAVWITEATTTAARRARMPPPVPVQTLAVFAPAVGPVLLCTVRAKASPAYVCLRRVDPASTASDAQAPAVPVPHLSVARKITRLKTSLTADKLAAKVMSTYASGIKRCYAAARKAKPTAGGTLALKLTVNAVGKPEAITVKSFDAKLTACVKTQVATWRFAIPQGEYGSPIAARYELDLKLAMKRP